MTKKNVVDVDGVRYLGKLIAGKEKLMVGYVTVKRLGLDEVAEDWQPRFVKVCYQQEGVPFAVKFESGWHEYPDVDGAWHEAEDKLFAAAVREQPALI